MAKTWSESPKVEGISLSAPLPDPEKMFLLYSLLVFQALLKYKEKFKYFDPPGR